MIDVLSLSMGSGLLSALIFAAKPNLLDPAQGGPVRAEKANSTGRRMARAIAAGAALLLLGATQVEYFAPPPVSPKQADLIFTGSMDWLPNIDAMEWFAAEILPLIHKEQADCRLLIAGRRPTPGLQDLAQREPRIALTGTVPDIRPYVWGSTISVVPLRIGGGTRLKIFEAIAAKVPVVSSSVGAEGLPLEDGKHILIADTPEDFARKCLQLLASPEQRRDLTERAWELVAGRFSWQAVTRDFEAALEAAPRPN